MHFRPTLALLAAIGLTQVAQAATPYSEQALGAAQGVLDFCSKVDRDDDKALKERAQWLYRGLTAKEIEKIQHGDAFRKSHATLQSVLGELSAANAKAACHAIGPPPDLKVGGAKR